MPANDQRRAAIARAAVTVIARDGLRGLTHRAVDAAAGLPVGTTSNYHRSRRDLLVAASEEALDRLRPRRAPAPGGGGIGALVEGILGYVDACLADREALVAWFDLRLLAARDPSLDVVNAAIEERHAANLAYGERRGLPGSDDEHHRLLLALDGVLLAAATGSLTPAAARVDAEALVRAVVVPDGARQRRWFGVR